MYAELLKNLTKPNYFLNAFTPVTNLPNINTDVVELIK